MNRITVIPKEGLQVIDPATRSALPVEGAEVEDNVYWRRRLINEEITLAEATKPVSNKPTVKSK